MFLSNDKKVQGPQKQVKVAKERPAGNTVANPASIAYSYSTAEASFGLSFLMRLIKDTLLLTSIKLKQTLETLNLTANSIL